MLVPKSVLVLAISFPLLALSAPMKCPTGGVPYPCVPDPDSSGPGRADAVRARSAVPEPNQLDTVSQKVKRTGPASWPYYLWPAPPGPVKIERSAEPEPVIEPVEPHTGPPPHYVYSDKVYDEPITSKREAEPEPEPVKALPNPLPPHYLYQDTAVQERSVSEAPTPVPTASASPYYGYRVG